jgi:hypothetical protein
MKHRPFCAVAAAFLFSAAVPALGQVAGRSDTCGPVNGKTATDRDNALRFCAGSVPKDLQVSGVIAMDSIVWVMVGRQLANVMRNDRLSTEQVVKRWMRAWKSITERQAVTVYVEWQDVEIAKGEVSLVRGDVVTIK